jgi:hypothetical protein
MANTTNFGWETPDDTDLVKDGAAAMRTLGSAIDTSMMDLKGGTSGQILSKNSNTDMDFVWVTSDDANAIQNAIVDAKGDLITATAADTPARLAVGTNGQYLSADSTASTGLKWVSAPAAGSTLLAYLYGNYAGNYSTTSTTFVDLDPTAFDLTFTAPSSGNVLLRATMPILAVGTADCFMNWRDGTTNLTDTTFRLLQSSQNNVQASWACRVTGLSGSKTLSIGVRVSNSATTFYGFLNSGNFFLEAWSL